MIKIIIPEFDGTVRFDEIKEIPKRKSGLYAFYNENDELMYIGKATHLKERIYKHIKGLTNTSAYSHNFYKCSFFFEEEPLYREIYETYMISTMKPILNKSKTIYHTMIPSVYKRNRKTNNEITNIMNCKAITLTGDRCSFRARDNGYCKHHNKSNVG